MEKLEKPPTTKGPADWFTGDVYVDAIAQAQGAALTSGAVPPAVTELPSIIPCNWSLTSCAVWTRSSGSFARQLRTSRSMNQARFLPLSASSL